MGKIPIEYIITIMIGCGLTWLIFILALAKFSKVCSHFADFTQVLQFKFERKNEQLNLEKQPLTCYISISYNKLKI